MGNVRDPSLVFVFGTLKEGFPNFAVNTGHRLPGTFRTKDRLPLYLVGERRVPWLVDAPGQGHRVAGQVFAVGPAAMHAMDVLERVGEPGGYVRVQLNIEQTTPEARMLRAEAYLKPAAQLTTESARVGPLDEYTLEHAALYRKRLLRRLASSDLPAFQAYRTLPETSRYQGWSPMSQDEAAAFLAEMATAPLFTPGTWIQLGIADPDGDGLAGDVGLFLSEDGREAEVGFTLAPAAQGRGLATAAVREAIDLAYATTKIERVLAVTDSRNARSIRLLERLGFRCADRCDVVFRGEPCVELVYALERGTVRR